jgi:signal peptidase I
MYQNFSSGGESSKATVNANKNGKAGIFSFFEHPFFKHPVVENIISLATAALVVFAIKSSLFEAYKVPTGSMIPTIFIGDHIFANKFAYGLKIPFSDLVFKEAIFLWKRSPPQRGDIIVFLNPRNEDIYFIKRVIGVPGDVIEIRNKLLYVNSEPMVQKAVALDEAKKIVGSLDDPEYDPSEIVVFEENLKGVEHLIFTDKHVFSGENVSSLRVPSDCLFVMGDNRDRSNDSRFWGFVPLRNVKGQALFVFASFFFNFDTWSVSVKLQRTGTVIR